MNITQVDELIDKIDNINCTITPNLLLWNAFKRNNKFNLAFHITGFNNAQRKYNEIELIIAVKNWIGLNLYDFNYLHNIEFGNYKIIIVLTFEIENE